MKTFYKIPLGYCTLFCALILLVVSSCEEMPTAVEQTAGITFIIRDNSGFMESLYGSSEVTGAQIRLRSINYGIDYTIRTGESGIAVLDGVVSDIYSCIIERVLSPEDVYTVTGAMVERRLIGGMSAVEIRADRTGEVVEIELDLAPLSDVVISELYTTGPPGAGLYWHDKYVEIFNMSDEVVYLDGILIAWARGGFINEPDIYSKQVWMFPGDGEEYPIQPKQFMVLATDAIDHRINAPESIDLSNADFEFYLPWAPDIDNPNIPNMIPIYQPSGFDWLMGGELGAFVLARVGDIDTLRYVDDHLLIPKSNVTDGVEYLRDPSRLDQKVLDPKIDAGATGGVQFYTGRSMERKLRVTETGWTLEDNNNSSIDFVVLDTPTPGYHHELPDN
jgi:hypothetical protein